MNDDLSDMTEAGNEPCVPFDRENADSGLTLAQQVDRVPCEPGCYLWKSKDGEVLYVGKAKNLRARMKQYVGLQDSRAMIPELMSQAVSFDYIVCTSEHEALVLEMNLIGQYDPAFNVAFRDDKSYPYIALTCADPYPAIKFTREKHKAKTRYFGPYTNSRAARQTIDMCRKVVPVCSANCPQWKQIQRKIQAHPDDAVLGAIYMSSDARPCFDACVGLGPGLCCGLCSEESYRANVRAAERFLSGHHAEFEAELREEMLNAAADLDFERAARLRDRLEALQQINQYQQVVFSSSLDMDVIGFYREETVAAVHVFAVREGRTRRSCEFILDKGLDTAMEDLAEGFLKRYYASGADIPDEVCLEAQLADAELLEAWLTEQHPRKVHIHVPRRGEKKKLLDLATKNAQHSLLRFMVRTSYADKRTNDALLQLESALALPHPPYRIECYDISTLHGRFTVASMVVFINGRPDPSQYRKFKIIQDFGEANDFLSMQEVLGRRFAPERLKDEKFASLPDLLIVDGGKPQLSAATQQLEALGVDVSVAGLAKSDEELFVPWAHDGPIVLPSGSASLYLVKQVRDESHRFAITYHRTLRDRAMTKSALDDIDGIGPKRKKAIMKAFGSLKRLKRASADEIAFAAKIPADVAERVWKTFHEQDS